MRNTAFRIQRCGILLTYFNWSLKNPYYAVRGINECHKQDRFQDFRGMMTSFCFWFITVAKNKLFQSQHFDFICKCNSYLLIVVRAVFILYEAIRCLRHQGSTYDDVGTFIWHCLIKSYWPFSSCRSFSGEHSTIRLRCSSSSGSPHWFPWDCFVSKVVDYCNLYLTCEVD